MPIIPSGKTKIMEAQSLLGTNQWGLGGDFGSNPVENPGQQPGQQPEQQSELGQTPASAAADPADQTDPTKQKEVGQEEGDKPDLLEYVYKVLEKLGYPPRRLDAFSDEFVSEKMFPGGVKEIAITLPDRYYGQKKRLSDNDLSKIMNSVQEQYGLILADAERKDKKVVMNFTSQPQGTGEEEEEVPGDDLDEIFGTPKGQEGSKQKSVSKAPAKTLKNPKNKRMAKTIHELVKESHDDIVNKLLVVAASIGRK